MSHYLGEGWSERNPIPTVQSYEREKREREGLDEPSAVSQFMDRWVYSPHDERDPGVASETGPSSDGATAGSHGKHGEVQRSMHNQLGQVPDTQEHFLNAHDLESRNYSNQQPADDSPDATSALNGTPSYLQSGRVHHSGTTLDNSGVAPRIVVGGSTSNGQITTAGQAGTATSGGLQQRPSYETISHSDRDSYTGAQSLKSTSSAGLHANQDPQKGQEGVSSGGQRSDASEGGVENQRSNKKSVPGAGGGEEEKNRIKEQAAKSQRKTDNQFVAKGEREVDDPITGRGVIIHDGNKNFDIDPKRLDSRFEGGYSTERLMPNAVQDERYSNPDPVQPSSVLLQTFPEPPNMEVLNEIKSSFNNVALWVAALLIVVWAMSAFGHGWSAFFFRTTILSLVGLFIYGGLGLAYAKVQKSIEVVRASMHKQRGEKFCPPMPESAEWLNAIVACLWKQLNPEMFVSVLDMVEDIMQSSLPGFIQAVKISDFGLGENPVRMIAMRALADVMTDPEYPRKTWIEHSPGMDDGTEGEGEDPAQFAEGQTGEELHRAKQQDEAGDFLNMEVSFCYSAMSGETTKDRSKNVHMLVEFFLGAFDWVEFPLPVWVQIDHVMGTVRIRAQITSEPPFLRNVTISLMGVPSVSIRAIPMAKFLPNVLDLPLISNFVQSSIAAACNMYVAPKSMTLNMTDMLAGDGVKKDTDALGVLMVTIHYGVDLSSQDVNGKSDPYTVLSFAKFGRPLYATRIIFEDLNPVWEETAFLLVSRDDLRSGESLSLQLWDNDKRSADDIVGRVNVPLTDLIRKPNETITKTTQLMGFEDADEMQGQLHWSAGFFEKSKLNKKLQKKHNEKAASQAEQESKREPSPIDTDEEARTLSTPPDPQWPSGILSVIVRHIDGLENREVEKGVKGSNREGSAGQDVEATMAELPSSYAEVILNDNLAFKTRVKQYSNMPFFNAGTEMFVRDWTKSELRVVIRDARVREHDPIMGIVSLPLRDLFKGASQVEQMFSLQDGVGYGKVALSLLFKAVKLEIPRELRGFNTVHVDILSNIELDIPDKEWNSKLQGLKVTIIAGLNEFKMKALKRHPESSEEDPLITIPVYDRYSTLMVFEFGRNPIPGLNKPNAISVLPLCELEDDQTTEVVLPVVHADNAKQLERNYIDAQCKDTHKFKEVGTISMRVRVNPGLSEHFRPYATGARDRHEFEVYERLVGLPWRAEQNSHANDDGVITRHEKKDIKQLQTEQLHMRHRGAMGYTPVRTAKWAKDGLKDHVKQIGSKILGKEKRMYCTNSHRRSIDLFRDMNCGPFTDWPLAIATFLHFS